MVGDVAYRDGIFRSVSIFGIRTRKSTAMDGAPLATRWGFLNFGFPFQVLGISYINLRRSISNVHNAADEELISRYCEKQLH